ncbi:MAG: hypothetical protein KAR21_06250, partial [Spirochaetales bacterium]|nr:hypothetical protein [Spirochaetales bacterium]
SSPGVSFTIPFLENRITINDSYNEVNIPLAESVIRENSIVAKAGISSIKLQGGSVYSSQNLIRTWGVSTNTIWEKGSRLSTDLDLSMYSEEDTYEHMNSFEKLASSYELFIPGDIHNDRTTNISINPEINTNSASFGINETFGSNISGLDKRILATGQSLSVDAEFTFNSESPGQFSITPGYEKIINSQIDENTDSNFFTDTKDSILHLGTHDYYFTGIPLWEIIDPEFGNQFIKNTEGQRNTEYIPEFSLRFTRLAGSHLSDIIIPSIVNINVSRYLTRDFDSITDKLKVNLETRATALNVFGKLGSTPLVSWYQTEEITNILSIGGEYKSYMTDVLEDPVFNLNHTLYLNFNINKQDSVDLESSHNWTWMPLDWNSSTSGSYNWQVEPRKPIKIPLLYKEESEGKPYFEHIEKLTVSTSIRDEQKEYSLTLTANHTTNLIISDTGIISLYAGIGWDQKNITTGDVTTKYYLLGIEAGISAKLTF